jgi:NAD(P)H-dependent flavin oxidoreductase YrpB (nitropropane dioxygenase family)
MHNTLCDVYGIDAPIFAFSHSPAVVLAVTQAGGFGVLGAAGMEPEQLDQALQMLTRECWGKSFGIDLIIPEQYVGREEGGLSLEKLQSLIPQGHRDFLDRLLDDYHVPRQHAPLTLASRAGTGISEKRGKELVDIALAYPVKLIVNALGVPPVYIIKRAHQQGVLVGALVGAVKHAVHQKEAGVDLIIAQGFEAGGHTGEIASMVLTPQVVDNTCSYCWWSSQRKANGRCACVGSAGRLDWLGLVDDRGGRDAFSGERKVPARNFKRYPALACING